MVSALLSAGAALASTFIPNSRLWTIENADTKQKLQGQFEPTDVTKSMDTRWGEFTSLNRDKSILQFLNGSNSKVSFTGRFFKSHALDKSPEDKLALLESWRMINASLRRPPILTFWVGDGHLKLNCVITSLTTTYGRPDAFGGLRDASFSISLLEFTTFSLDDEIQTHTRYATAGERDYFESLAFEEYGDPMIGDVIRKMHPQYQGLQPGDIVELPSIEFVRGVEVTQTSIPFKTGFGQKDTAQKRLRLAFVDKRGTSYVSHLMQKAG